MSAEDSSVSNRETQPTVKPKTGTLLSLSNSNSKEESGDSVNKILDYNMLRPQPSKSDNKVEQEAVSGVETNDRKP